MNSFHNQPLIEIRANPDQFSDDSNSDEVDPVVADEVNDSEEYENFLQLDESICNPVPKEMI